MTRLAIRTFGIGAGLRGQVARGVRRVWCVTLTLATGEVVMVDVETHFEAAAISRAKAKLHRGDVVVAESAVLV